MQESRTNIKICSFFGSPNLTGDSSQLHDAYLTAAHYDNVRRFYISDLNISPCTGCGFCKKNDQCCIDDAMTEIYKVVRCSDIITFSFPLYFTSIPGKMKSMIDRFQVLWEESKRGKTSLVEKKGIIFVTAGSEYKDMFEPSKKIISHVMNSINGKLILEESIFCPGLDSDAGRAEYLDVIKRLRF